MRNAAITLAVALLIAACELPLAPRDIPFGFTRSSARAQLDLEKRFRALPDRSRLRETHHELTRLPHPAGSDRDRELAEWTADQFKAAAMEDVRIVTHDVLLPKPIEIVVEMSAPQPWRATLQEKPLAAADARVKGDPGGPVEPAHHAYSASGDLSAPVVFAGYGTPAEYDWLSSQSIDVRGRIVLVRYSRPYRYRGFKAYVAQQRGAAGILMYSDPADDGAAKGPTFPVGPWSPSSRIERGGIVYDFLTPGDPLTPGWASVEGARRLAPRDAVTLPQILSVPLSADDARVILSRLEGPGVPSSWRGGLPLDYRAGPSAAPLRMSVRMDDRVRPVWTVTGLIRGREHPDQVVIVGNHRDAWIYGGVDPSSGSAALIELARAVGALVHDGWRPKRSLLFASWDAEEFATTSSTEWGEQHERWLRERAVAYLNVDSAASGSQLAVSAVPSLSRLLSEVAQAVQDPVRKVPVGTVARDQARTVYGLGGETPNVVIGDRMGGGSDYVVFLNFLGIPVADLAFDGPYGVYHSAYDTHDFVARIADPGFAYHAALVELWGLTAMRLSNADALPLDPDASARRISELARQVAGRMKSAKQSGGAELETAALHLQNVTTAFTRARDQALDAGDAATLAALNRQVLKFERAFLDPAGLPGRAWYRHVIYAPAFTYEPQVLPGLSVALDARDTPQVEREARRIVAALQRAAAQLDGW